MSSVFSDLRRREVLAGLLASAAATPALSQSAPTASAAGRLNDLLADIAHENMLASPETAGRYGLDVGSLAPLKRRLDDRSLAGAAAMRELANSQLLRLNAIDRHALAGMDAVNYAAIQTTLAAQDMLARRYKYSSAIGPQPYIVSQLTGSYTAVPEFLDTRHMIANAEDADVYLERLTMFATVLHQECERVVHDASLGAAPPDFVQDRALTQLKALRDQKPEESGLVAALVRKAKAAGLTHDYAPAATKIIREHIAPAIEAQIGAISTLRPTARSGAGVCYLPDGKAYYDASLRIATTTAHDADELHRLGLDLSAQLGSQLTSMLTAQGYDRGSLPERMLALLGEPRYIYANTDAGKTQLIDDVRASLAEMRRRLPRDFHRLPAAAVQIRPVPQFLESGEPFASYEDPSIDGSRPGIFYVNLRDTSEIPKWILTTTSFHEAVPGHHLQQAVLQEGPSIPLIRKIVWSSGYGEGWGLYAEQLADELGMYDHDPVGRIGYIWAALLRAGRLVGDTGVNAKRWTRQQTVTWMVEHAGLPHGLAVNEVERYCVWPGQACSYMVGKTAWIRLRDRAKARLGPKYDIRDFHTATLAVGAVPLTVLEDVVDHYIQTASA